MAATSSFSSYKVSDDDLESPRKLHASSNGGCQHVAPSRTDQNFVGNDASAHAKTVEQMGKLTAAPSPASENGVDVADTNSILHDAHSPGKRRGLGHILSPPKHSEGTTSEKPSKTNGWFASRLNRKHRAKSVEVPVIETVAADRIDGPIVGGLPVIAGPVPTGDAAPASLDNSPVGPASISAPASLHATPTPVHPGLPPPPNGTASMQDGKPRHRRHRSLLTSLGWNRRASTSSGDLDSTEKALQQGGSNALLSRQMSLGSRNSSAGSEAQQSGADFFWDADPGQMLPAGLHGITNAGNTCFVNAALQCLRYTPGLPLMLVPDLLDKVRAKQTNAASKPVKDGLGDNENTAEADGNSNTALLRPLEAGADVAASVDDSGPVTTTTSADAGKPVTQTPATERRSDESTSDTAAVEQTAPLFVENAKPCGSNGSDAVEGVPAGDENAARPMEPTEEDPDVGGIEISQGDEAQDHASIESGELSPEPAAPPSAPAPHAARPARGELATAIADLVCQLYVSPQDDRAAANASPLLQTLRRFPLASDYFNGGQQDCQEVLQLLLDLLHEDLNRIPVPPRTPSQHTECGENGARGPSCSDAETNESVGDASAATGLVDAGASEESHHAPVAAKAETQDVETLQERSTLQRNVQSRADAAQSECSPVVQQPTAGPQATPFFTENSISEQTSSDERAAAASKDDEASKADVAWQTWLRHSSSPISDLFMGQLQSEVTCLQCGGRFTQYEPFWELSLPLVPKSGGNLSTWLGLKPGGTLSLQDCLRAYTAEEKLGGEEAFACETCGKRTSATKKLRLHRLPDALVLHIKRFRARGSGTDKLSTDVAFPLHALDLRSHLSPESPNATGSCTYDLYAVSNHSGTLSGGHYTAVCRVGKNHLASNGKASAGGSSSAVGEGWYQFNDEVVTPTAASQVVSQQAYILFYARRKMKAPADALNAQHQTSEGTNEALQNGKHDTHHHHRHSRSRSGGSAALFDIFAARKGDCK